MSQAQVDASWHEAKTLLTAFFEGRAGPQALAQAEAAHLELITGLRAVGAPAAIVDNAHKALEIVRALIKENPAH